MILYRITNKINGKRYIGQTIQLMSIRWSQHIHSSIKNKNNTLISRTIKKYGKENFEVKVIARCNSIEEMNHREQYYIKLFNTLAPNGYNLDSGGKNKIMHQSTKDKLSKAHLGKKCKPFTQEHKNAISKTLKERRIKPLLTPEIIAKIALSSKGKNNGMFGKKHTKESKKSMSLKRKGKKIGMENPFFGKTHSEETKKRLSEAKNKMKIKVFCENNQKVYSSLKDASKDTNISKTSIKSVIDGKYLNCKGFIFKKV
jgi:group I intron endonuclease